MNTPIVSEPSSNDKLLAGLSYLWVLSILVLVLKRKDEFVAFHAKQGFVLWIASIVFWVIPIFGALLNLLLFIVIVIAFVQALNGGRWRVPLVAELADKIRW